MSESAADPLALVILGTGVLILVYGVWYLGVLSAQRRVDSLEESADE